MRLQHWYRGNLQLDHHSGALKIPVFQEQHVPEVVIFGVAEVNGYVLYVLQRGVWADL